MTCREVILNYINKHDGWVKKVTLYAEAEDWSPETVGRLCRDLEKESEIKVDYYKSRYTKRRLAMYSKKDYFQPKQKVEVKELPDGTRIAVLC